LYLSRWQNGLRSYLFASFGQGRFSLRAGMIQSRKERRLFFWCDAEECVGKKDVPDFGF
jgi:hypothetical protein